MNNIERLEEVIKYVFKDKKLINLALTHSSYANEHKCHSNENLEFMGDSVLDLCMAKFLYNTDTDEGNMTKTRAMYVCEEALAIYALKLNLGEYLNLGVGEDLNGGRLREALLADAFEAVIGAVFLDGGFEESYKLFERIVLPHLEAVHVDDYKSKLQEFLAADRRTIVYNLVSESGPPHDKTYEMAAVLEGNIVLGVGFGKRKNEAGQNAAKQALDKIAK